MAGYVKMWTTLRNNTEFLSLSIGQRGMYMQLILACKEQRDDGTVCYRNVTALGSDCGCERKTAGKTLGILTEKSLCTYVQNGDGVLTITIPNYKHWQELNVEGVREKTRKNPTKIPSLRPDQTRPDQTIPPSATDLLKKKKKTDPRIKVFIDWWFQEYGVVFPGEKYLVQGGKDAVPVKRLLGSASLEDAQKAAAWFLRFESDDWLGSLSKEISLFVMKYNEIRQRMMPTKELQPGDPGYVPK